MRRPLFPDNHRKISNPLFLTISKERVVFATDDFYKTVFFFSQCRIPRKLNFIRKSCEGVRDDPILSTPVDIFKTVWSTISGLTLFKEENYFLVADPCFYAILFINPEKKGINVETTKNEIIYQ